MEFSQILTELMEKKGWTQYRLARMMDCSQSTVAHWLAGDTKPSKIRMKQLGEVFGVSEDYLNGKENAATESRDDVLDALLEDERVLLQKYRTASEEDKMLIREFIRRFRGAD